MNEKLWWFARARVKCQRYRGLDAIGHPVRPVISIVMPAHNEQAYLSSAVGRVLDGLHEREESFEILICENGSSDDTQAEARALATAHSEVHFIGLAVADYGQALRTGFLAAQGDLVVNFDVDLVDLGFLDAAVALADKQPELSIIVGSKRGPGSDDQRGAARRGITWVFSFILRRGFGLRVSDTHGLEALRRAPLLEVVAKCRFGAEIFDTELILRAERAGLAVTEIPVTVSDQRPPRTSIARRIPRTLLGLSRLRLALWQERGAQDTKNATPPAATP
jgi:glycosyltransferase involved in cell wall biosynthesis